MVKYKVTYRYHNDKTEHEKVVVASSSHNAQRKVEASDIHIIDVREDLPSWGDSLIGKAVKFGFKKLTK